MYIFQYLKYFAYLAWHWNTRLALFVVRHEIIGEKKFDIQTTGVDNLHRSLSSEQLMHASIYQPINFYTAEKLFAQLQPADLQGSFLDAGCGKGRAMAMAAYYQFKSIFAFDLSPAMCADAIELASALEKKYPSLCITVDCEDAAVYQVADDVSVVFLFNPFDDYIMHFFVQQLMKSLQKNPRRLKVLYANPLYKERFIIEGFTETFHFRKLTWLEGSVLEYHPPSKGH